VEAAARTSQTSQRSPPSGDTAHSGGAYGWIVGFIAATIGVRLIGITQPLVGTFATKHCVYAMIARNWGEGRAPFWQPTLDCLAGNERAWHLMEWPASAYAAACGWRWFGGSLDLWGRAVSIFCMAAATLLAYLLARRWFGEPAARATSLIVGLAPISIIYGRGFMLEPSLVCLSFLAIYAFDTWLRNRRIAWLIVSAIALALSVLTKVYQLLLIIPLLVLLVRSTIRGRAIWIPTIVGAVALIPAAAWYYWVSTVAATSGPAVDYHPSSRAAIHGIPHPLLLDPAYYLGVARNLATMALTPLGLLLVVIGLCDRRARLLLPWCASCALLLFLLPLKFHVADYYYLNLLPPAALLAGLGWQVVVERLAPSRSVAAIALAGSLLIAARYTIGPTWRLADEDRDVTTAAAVVREVTAVDEPVATLHGSTLDLLYYCNRRGWAFDAADTELPSRLIAAEARGAKWLVVVHPAHMAKNELLTQWLSSRPVERSGDDWRIYRLDGPAIPSADGATAAESPPLPAPRTVAP
jgi:hypothetical protein